MRLYCWTTGVQVPVYLYPYSENLMSHDSWLMTHRPLYCTAIQYQVPSLPVREYKYPKRSRTSKLCIEFAIGLCVHFLPHDVVPRNPLACDCSLSAASTRRLCCVGRRYGLSRCGHKVAIPISDFQITNAHRSGLALSKNTGRTRLFVSHLYGIGGFRTRLQRLIISAFPRCATLCCRSLQEQRRRRRSRVIENGIGATNVATCRRENQQQVSTDAGDSQCQATDTFTILWVLFQPRLLLLHLKEGCWPQDWCYRCRSEQYALEWNAVLRVASRFDPHYENGRDESIRKESNTRNQLRISESLSRESLHGDGPTVRLDVLGIATGICVTARSTSNTATIIIIIVVVVVVVIAAYKHIYIPKWGIVL